jgi:hypothetical protein
MKPLKMDLSDLNPKLISWAGKIAKKIWPSLYNYFHAPEYHIIKKQLLERKAFPYDVWKSYDPDLDMENVIQILKILQMDDGWPNYYFLPDDPVFLILKFCIDDYGPEEVFWHIKTILKVEYEKNERNMIIEKKWTVGQFVKDIINKRVNVILS